MGGPSLGMHIASHGEGRHGHDASASHIYGESYMKSRKSQSGFTLVEIAVVLVIIGLLLGAILKGQELIENGRAKNALSEVTGIRSAHFSYMDRYKKTPGDDGTAAQLAARGGAWVTTPAMTAGDNDGVMEATAAQTFTGTGENDDYFRHLRAAGFLTGDVTLVTQAALPTNAFGGRTSVTNAAVHGLAAGPVKVCQGNVPGKAAAAMDTQADDGRPGTGSMRASLGANNTAPTAAALATTAVYDEGQTYTTCTAF